MKKKTVAVMSIMALLLSGCGGDFPDLTDEQAEVIGEYAAVTLLKYDANSRSRLVDLAQVEEEPVEENEPVVEKKPEVAEPEPSKEPETEQSSAPKQSESTVEVENMVASMEEFLELPDGVFVSYKEYEMCQSYQEEGSLYFALEASEGKQILVVKFDLRNEASETREINLLDRRDNYRLTVNGTYTRTALMTLLANDLSTYIGTLEPGTSQEVVLLIEVDETEAKNVQMISLNLKNELKTYTIQLL